MPIEIVDMVKKAHELKKRKVLINTKRFHAWVHYYPTRGTKTICTATMRTRPFMSSKENAQCIFRTAAKR